MKKSQSLNLKPETSCANMKSLMCLTVNRRALSDDALFHP